MKRAGAASGLVPYITSREGEYGAPESELTLSMNAFGSVRLAYRNETPADRGPHGELWARCSQSVDASGSPAGKPQWRLVNPARQLACMRQLRCQIGFCSAETDRGYVFLAGSAEGAAHRGGEPVRTAQPPVCLKHVRPAIELCPHLRKGHVAFRARATSVWGVIGSRYRLSALGLEPLPAEHDDAPVPYGHPQVSWFLASQLVRELRDYEVVNLDDLVPAT
ncbi:hypothetical protein [Streptomyces sp. NBC_01285]|uniref:hypothetical protein n=1 Tax=Streptomyces sp. NBC_01285 TaxID=2903813 RepID=UPI00224FE26F|nr:hypothetical protein [Streptomyces sp. NBC_01285]MCX4773732.1 hypothetical protein [Streptomyces sp. NBC_01285]